MQVLHDSRHGPYRTVGEFFVHRFFLCLHQQQQRPVFLQLSLSLSPSLTKLAPYSSIGPFRAGSKRNRARPTCGPVEMRFLIKFCSIFMKILACPLAGHPVTFLAMSIFSHSTYTGKCARFYVDSPFVQLVVVFSYEKWIIQWKDLHAKSAKEKKTCMKLPAEIVRNTTLFFGLPEGQ